MSKHKLKIALLIAGATASLVLFFHYDVHKFVLAWFWSVEDTAIIIGEMFLARRLTRPAWKWITDLGIILLVGFNTVGKWRRKIFAPLRVFDAWMIGSWRVLSVPYRIIVVTGACAIVMIVIYITYLIPLLLPISWSIIRKMYFWTGDRVFVRWMEPIRFRFHRFIHENRIARFTLKWPRRGLAIVKRGLERQRERRKANQQNHHN